jgi:hypothetical protein
LEDHQAYHQFVVVKVDGKISKKFISILNDLGYSHMDVTSKVVKTCALKK